MFKPFMALSVVVGVALAGCSGEEPTQQAAAGAGLVFFTDQETDVLRPAVRRYAAAYSDAVAPSSLKRCNQALEWENTDCFTELAGAVDGKLRKLADKTPGVRGYHPDCRSGLKEWQGFLKKYLRYSGKLHLDFATGDYNRVTAAMERYPALVDYDGRLNTVALPALQAACYPDGDSAR